MAATGGGKIRSRRYHTASKPYAKSKQQQPGLISRVTDTVKSIVPSWLQKYFRNGEAAEGGGAAPGAGQNNQAPPPNGSEEVAPPHDGRDSPEPSTSNTEPSTSRVSLNFQDHVLSRPPLNRSHLHFPSLDTSTALGSGSSSGAALFSQPSTSAHHAHPPFPGSAFATGTASSSGFSLVKEIKDTSSQHEDDNISTTSGFSSRASEKDVPTSKTASLPQLWSPETDRTHSGPQPAQSSLKRPAFNLSVFGTSSTSTMNSSGLNSSQLGDSPFYPGKTTYGGAASVRTARSRPATPYQAPMRRQMKAKPAGAQPCGVTSATARRILQSLERMSSPLADAKRIPSAASSHLSTSPYGTILERSHLPAKRKRDSPLPPVQKLVIPSAASSAGNRSMSFRASLTPAGLGRPLTPAGLGRPLTPREQPARQSPEVADVVAGPSESTSSLPYPLSTSTPAASGTGSGGGKMKRDRTSTRQSNKRPDDDVVEVLDLPAISLPISTFSLPTFSFSSPPPAAPVTSTVTPMATELVTTSKDSPAASPPGPCVPFTFASPIVMTTTAASPPSFSPTAGFTFSAPVAKTGPSVSNGKMATPTLAGAKSSASEEPEEFEGLFKPAKVLKQGSVLDLLKTPGFASPARSSPDPAPAVSTAPSSSSSSSSGFGDLFKPPAGSWSCDICMVQNKPTDAKCVACQSPQPNTDSSSTPSDCKPAATTASRLETTTTTTTTPIGFGTLFSTPAGTWDCDTCLVQNKPEAVKCVACQTLKPGTGVKLAPPTTNTLSSTTTSTPASSGFAGFGDKFKKSEGAWECDTCMVENSAQDSKCVACMSAKPGAASASLAPPPTSSTPLLGFGDKFKKPEGSWECDVCCVQNKAADLQCVACQTTKPGAKVEPKASSFGVSSNSGSGGFKFGTSSSLSDSTSGTGGFKFGATAPDSALSASSGGFKFGVSSSSGELKFGGGLSETTFNDTGFKFGVASSTTTASDDDKKAEPPTMGVGFKFGAADTPSSTESKPSEGGFSFGLAKPEATTTTSFPSSFSVPAASQEKTGKDSGSSVDSTSTTTATTTAASLFGSGAEPARTAAPLGGATFGAAVAAASAEKELPAPSFTFGKPEEKEPSVTSGFLFGAAGKEAEGTSAPSVGFSFSKPDPPKEPAQPSFSFGKRERERDPSPKSETPAEAPKASFSFGQSATDAAAPVFGFMASSSSSSSTTSSSSSTTPAPSMFGTPSSTTTAPSTTFLFGQGSSSDAPPPAKSFLFGQNQIQDSQPAPLAAPPTLNAAPVAPAPAQPFLFGSAVTTAAPAAQSSFAFGAAAPSAASSTAPPPSVGPSPFVFSSASSTGFGSGQAPTFGQVSSQPSAPAFGSPAPSPFMAAASQPPAFGATSVFGTPANSTSGGGFQFGGAGAFGAANSSAGVFSFGGAQAGSPAPSATPSITPQPSAPGGGFNFAQPPTFNMGSAKNNFTASPAGQNTIAGRKIKTAVRRRK